MHSNEYIAALAAYAEKTGLIEACDRVYTVNRLLEILQLDSCEPCEAPEMPLEDILQGLLQDAVSRGVCEDDVTSRDLFDTKLMGALTPAPPRGARKICRALCSVTQSGDRLVLPLCPEH